MTTSPITITAELLDDILLDCEDSELYQFGEYHVALPTARVLALVEHIRSLTERIERSEKDAGRYRIALGEIAECFRKANAECFAGTISAIDAAIAQEGAEHE